MAHNARKPLELLGLSKVLFALVGSTWPPLSKPLNAVAAPLTDLEDFIFIYFFARLFKRRGAGVAELARLESVLT
jgi:hypothetical protein